MTRPRFITEGMTFFVTVRAVNRSFRFVPRRKVREVIDYCLTVVLERFRNEGMLCLHEFKFMSNHYHLLGTDMKACLSQFVQDLNSLLSRELNALRGMSGSNIEKGFNLVRIHSAERLVGHAIYTLANPVSANLVARARHWKGTSSVRMRYGKPVVIRKPKLGLWAGKRSHAKRRASQRSKRANYAARSKLPETAELIIDRPPILPNLSDEQLRAHILKRLDGVERICEAKRQKLGIRVIGFAKAATLHFLAIPQSEEMFSLTPEFSASHVWERVALAAIRKKFLEAYYAAYELFAGGERGVAFPVGTWLMRRRFGVPCVPLAA